jgi:beta-glucuronidase
MPATSAAIDPFAHLHDEAYASAFDNPQLGVEGFTAIAGRPSTSLNGAWYFTLDLFDEGLRQRWFADTPMPAAEWPQPRDYDAGQGQTLEIPGCWTAQKEAWSYFEGGAWYSRTLQHLPDPARPRSVLHIGAANYQARIFVNGQFVGSHLGGSTPFCVELTAYLRPGENSLQIQVDNRRTPARVPMHHFDWFNHGGIYRDACLLQLSEIFIRNANVQLVPDGSFSRLAVSITLSDRVSASLTLTIAELGIDQALQAEDGCVCCEIQATPQLWSPAHPSLYAVSIRLGQDVWQDQIGFREVRASGQQILLNGDVIYLKGICVHEDDEILGKVSTEADVRRRFEDARELGCNFMRLAHYPHHEHVARIADQLGFLLWEEIPVYWAIDFANPATYYDAENQLRELIHRDWNRASVILWGVGNENEDSDARLAFMRNLAQRAREDDPTRLVGAACLINREKFCIEDRLTDHIDVIGINEYFGWYEPDFSGLERLLSASAPNKPVIISETGADALAGHHGRPDEFFTEECQAHIYVRQLEIIAQAPYVCGFTPWLLYDFRSERRQTVFNQGFNRKGLIAQDKRTRKLAFDVLARYYRGLEQK